jgi:hypothetical protein
MASFSPLGEILATFCRIGGMLGKVYFERGEFPLEVQSKTPVYLVKGIKDCWITFKKNW